MLACTREDECELVAIESDEFRFGTPHRGSIRFCLTPSDYVGGIGAVRWPVLRDSALRSMDLSASDLAQDAAV
jgi:hypothetical protein